MGTMDGRVCVVTGASSGIGKAVVAGLAAEGATVVMACRDVDKGQAVRAELASIGGALEVMPLELGSFASIRAFAAALAERHPAVHVLVNNAALLSATRQRTEDGLERTMGVNHVGPHLLTRELVPLLRAGAPSRVVFVASDVQKGAKLDLDDLQVERGKYSGYPVYCTSKLLNLMDMLSWHDELAGSGVTVNGLHPGLVSTSISREVPLFQLIARLFFMSPEKAARLVLSLSTDPALDGVSGTFVDRRGPLVLNPVAADPAARARLWAMTEQLIAERMAA